MKKITFIGCGKIARMHANNLKGKLHLQFQSKSIDSAKKFAKTFNGNHFNTFKDALSSDTDAFFITSPVQNHFEQVIEVLKQNKSLIVEKPLIATKEELLKLEGAYRESTSPFFMIAENYYYKPILNKIKSLKEEYQLGAIKDIFLKKEKTQKTESWRNELGALHEGGIHFIAMISDLMNHSEIKNINIDFPKPKWPERHSILSIEFQNAKARLIYSWDTPSKTFGFFQKSYIQFENGRIEFESNGLGGVLIHDNKKSFFLPPGLSDLMGYKKMTEDILRSIEIPDPKPYSNFEKSVYDLNIIFDAYKNYEQ